jgi:hypothetical protein
MHFNSPLVTGIIFLHYDVWEMTVQPNSSGKTKG